jgi:uncharacterized membrane protein
VSGEGDEAERGGYDVSRLLAFSDGVFAIAITLLVLTIPVPNDPDGLPNRNALLASRLGELLPSLSGFALSFALVGAHWIIHHRVLRGVTRCDRGLLWLNLVLLLGICLVPFATSVLTRYGDTPSGLIAYAALQIGISFAYLALRLYLARQRGRGYLEAALALTQVVGFAASIPVAFVSLRWAYLLWFAGIGAARFLDTWKRVTER